jgi:hypothetical protein
MRYLKTQSILQALAMLCFATAASPQITGLCNTGQTPATTSGCTGVLVTPNRSGGGPNRDGNWQLAYPYPSTIISSHSPCDLTGFIKAWVDTPNGSWLPDSASTASEWITPFDGEGNLPNGWYVYRTSFSVPAVLSDGGVPTGVTINGQLASDNSTMGIYLESPAFGASCSLMTGQSFPVNPIGTPEFGQWWSFSVTNSLPITPGAAARLYFLIANPYDKTTGGPTPTGLRVEFFASSTFF